MTSLGKREPFERLRIETGQTCPIPGRWVCDKHPAIEIILNESDVFPPCHQGAGHHNKWNNLLP